MQMTRYCPNGDGAFEDWVRACPECGSLLHSTPPDEDDLEDIEEFDQDDIPIAWLANAANEIEATMWADTIRAQQIPVLVRPGGPGAGAWASAATFEHELYVREPDLARARAVLDTFVTPGFPAALRPRRRAPRVRRRSLRTAG
jgi:hypothetical protein